MSLSPPLTPQAFVAKWRSSQVRENAHYAEHFLDLCRLVGYSRRTNVFRASQTTAQVMKTAAARQVRQRFNAMTYGRWCDANAIPYVTRPLFGANNQADHWHSEKAGIDRPAYRRCMLCDDAEVQTLP